MQNLDRLVKIMATLRSESGCPWDREQTPQTLRPYVLEEAYEVVDAIDGGDPESLRLELGDLLLQVVFLARIAEERGLFHMDDVAAGISDKLVRRHPHVFAGSSVSTVQEVWKRWDEIKSEERRENGEDPTRSSRLDGVPRALPALSRARLFMEKAARAGFDWPDASGVMEKVKEEVGELEQVIHERNPQRIEEELGDLLFALVALAKHVGTDAEASLDRASAKFAQRFRYVESAMQQAGSSMEEVGPERLDELWREAKERTRG